MYRRLLLSLMLTISGLMMGGSAVASPPTQAITPSDVFSLAQYIPAEANLYISLRTDEAYIAKLDGYLGKFGGVYAEMLDLLTLPFDIDTSWTIERLSEGARIGTNKTFLNLLNVLGDEVAVASINQGQNGYTVYLAVQLVNSDGFVDILIEEGNIETAPQGDYRVFTRGFAGHYYWYISPTHAFAISNIDKAISPNFPTEDYAKLSDNPTFQAALTSLADHPHDLFMYVDGAAIRANPAILPTFITLGIEPESLTVSATGLDDGTMVLDMTVRPIATETLVKIPLSPDLTLNAPRNVDALIHGNNARAVVADLLARLPTSEQFLVQVQASLRFDIATFLDSLGGEYLVFAGYDPLPFHSILMGNGMFNSAEVVNSLQFGAAFQMQDATAASDQAAALSEIFAFYSALTPTLKTSQNELVGGVSTTRIQIQVELGFDEFWELNLVIAAKEDVLMISTAAALTDILTGQGRYTDIVNDDRVTAHLLAHPSAIGVLGSDVMTLVASSLATTLLFQQAQSMFTSLDRSEPTPIPAPTPDVEVVAPQILARIASLFPGATFSTNYDTEGIHRLRFTLAVGE